MTDHLKTLFGGFLVFVGLLFPVGWGMNLWKLMQMCCEVSGMLIARSVGVLVPPIGGIVGWL